METLARDKRRSVGDGAEVLTRARASNTGKHQFRAGTQLTFNSNITQHNPVSTSSCVLSL